MFEITLNGKTLYHPNSAECNVLNAVIHEALNDAGYMEITIPYTNPMYEELQERKGSIVVYKDNVEIWYGEIRDIEVDFSKNKELYVVGEAALLNDTVQPQRQIKGTKYQIFQEIIYHHNTMVDTDKEFYPGAIGNNANLDMEIVTDWEYSLDALREHLCEDEEYIRIRHLGGKRYVDIMPLSAYGRHSEQTIMFGENLLDYSEKSSGEQIATVCIPLGVALDEGGIEGYDNYLTCASVNGGKNYVELPGAVNRLGRITKAVQFEDIADPNELLTAAVNYLQSAQYAKLTLELSAVDLSILHSDIDEYSVGDYVRAICEPMGMDAWFPVRERETDLLDLANNKIALGMQRTKSITTQQIESISTLEKKMPNKDAILQAALRNASALINANGKNGYVSIRTDENNKPYEIIIMDDKDITQATRGWRWNLNGFGHGTKNAGDPDFTWETNVAITMDGSIVANYITTGTLKGIEITNGNGTFHVDENGILTASNASITGDINAGSNITGANIYGGYIEQTGAQTLTIKNGQISATANGGASIDLYTNGEDSNALYGSKFIRATLNGQSDICYTFNTVKATNSHNSDKRLKKNIRDISVDLSKKIINEVRPRKFFYKATPDELHFGIVAQEVEQVLKNNNIQDLNGLVYKNPDGFYGVDQKELIPHLINYVRDLQEQINKLKGEKT